MADATYENGVYRAQGADQLVVANGGSIKVETGGEIQPNSGTQASNVAEITITYTSNDPGITPDGAVTVADGSTPTVAELLELCEEIKANQDSIIAALEGVGVLASS